MDNIQLTLIEAHLSQTVSENETLEALWATCIKITKQMNFEYFSFSIQHPTPFTNPKIYTYGNYPFNTTQFITKQNPNIISGSFQITPEHLEILAQRKKQETTHVKKLNDSVFYITQSSLKPEGVIEHFLLARTHEKIDRVELKKLRTLIRKMTTEVHNKIDELNHPTPQTVNLSPREKEILLWGADGKTSEEIAIILGLSQDSINFHHKTIQKKIGTTNRAQAIAYAIIKGHL